MSTPLRILAAMFDVDTAGAVSKVEGLNKSLDIAKGALKTIAASALGAFSLHAVTHFIEEQIELGSVLNDTAEKLGVGTEELQKFQYAAGLSGVGAEEAGKALQFLNKNMGEAIGGSKEQSQTFAELGINLEDVKKGTKSATDLLPALADKFEEMHSDAERTATAMKLFGKNGASLLPLLKEGSGALAKMSEEFDALGLGIDQDFIKKADEAGDRLEILKLGFRSLKTRIAVEVLPGITDLARKFSGWVAWTIKLTRETHIVKEMIGAVGVTAVVAAGKAIYSWSKVLGLFPKGGNLIKSLFSLGAIGLVVAAFLILAAAIEDVVVMCQGGQSVIGDFLNETLGVEYTTQLVNDLNKAWQEMQPSIAELKPLIKDIGRAFAQALPYMIALVVDLIKVIMTAFIQLKGFAEYVADLINGGAGSSDRTAAKTAKQTADLWKSGSTLMKVLDAPATVPEGSVRQGTFSRGDTKIDVQVNGGPTNADTGRAVAAGVQDGISGADKRAAAAALFRGDE